jgi:bifunctional non-homologous end joining protein LigD
MKQGEAAAFSFIEPMKALPVDKLPEGDWLYEIKFDGYRALAFKAGKEVRLVSRNNKPFDYPQLLEALKSLPARRVILDGEIAALDEKGRSSFQLLQLFKSSGGVPLVYYVFDLLFLDGKDLRQEPLSARRKLLVQVLEKTPENIRLSVETAFLIFVRNSGFLRQAVSVRSLMPASEAARKASWWSSMTMGPPLRW